MIHLSRRPAKGCCVLEICIIIPTYNERDNIVELIYQILALPVRANIIVVDDHSPDGTGEIVDKLSRQIPAVSVIHRAGKLGLGSAYIAGFKQGLSTGADRLITMDADFSHDPAYIPDLVSLADDYQITIGSRYVRNGGVRNWDWRRRSLSWGANAFARTALGLRAKDCTAGFRCYHRDVLLSIGLDRIFSNGYSFLVEMMFRCQQSGFSIGEIPILFTNRVRGKSKISQREIYKAMYTVIRLSLGRLSSKSRLQVSAPPSPSNKQTSQIN
jgi:glycosyltransferase involved in cell wall biosynthesis